MKALITLLILLAILIRLHAQIFYSDTLRTIAYWKKGESYNYHLEKYRFTQKGEVTSEINTTSYITFYIQEETDSNYLIRFTTDSIKIKGEFESNPTMNALTSEISNKLTYLIATDVNGTFQEIKNWEELKDIIGELYSKMDIFLNIDAERKQEVNQTIKTITDSKEKIESMITKEFAILFSNYGYIFDTRDTIEYDEYLPNPYGGNPIPKAGKIYFDKSSMDSTNSLTLFDKSTIDQEEGKKAIVHALKQIYPDLKKMESEMKNIEFKIEDSISQEFDLNKGAIINALMERKVISNDLKEKIIRIDRQNWKLLGIK